MVGSGSAARPPGGQLAAQQRLLDEARALADVVILDTAPLLASSINRELATMVDSVVVLCRVGRTTAAEAERCGDLLAQIGAPAIGVVLVGVAAPDGSEYFGYFDAAPRSPRDASAAAGRRRAAVATGRAPTGSVVERRPRAAAATPPVRARPPERHDGRTTSVSRGRRDAGDADAWRAGCGGEPAFPAGLPFARPARTTARTGRWPGSRPSYERGILTNGPLVRELEAQVADRLGVGHVVAVVVVHRRADADDPGARPPRATGGDAELHVRGHRPRRGVGRRHPRFAECGTDDFLLDVDDAAARLDGAAAIVATHVFGAPCHPERVEELAAAAGVPVVFDAAHALGATRGGRPVGGFGAAEVFSLSPTKVVVAGEGGLVTTNDAALAERVRIGRDYGNPGDYDTKFAGLNARLSELHAALALESLDDLDEHLARRRQLVGDVSGRRWPPCRACSPQQLGAGDESTLQGLHGRRRRGRVRRRPRHPRRRPAGRGHRHPLLLLAARPPPRGVPRTGSRPSCRGPTGWRPGSSACRSGATSPTDAVEAVVDVIAACPRARRRDPRRREVGMRALVTGGAGFIGSHLVDALVADGADVSWSSTTCRPARRRTSRPTPTSSRATSPTRLRSQPRSRGCDVVFHLAARGSVQRSVERPLDDRPGQRRRHAQRAVRGARRRRAAGSCCRRRRRCTAAPSSARPARTRRCGRGRRTP